MAREAKQTFYGNDLPGALAAMGEGFDQTTRFANLELVETKDEFVYFDARDCLVASPVQTSCDRPVSAALEPNARRGHS